MDLLTNCNLPFRELNGTERLYDDADTYACDVVDAEYEHRSGYEDNPDYCALPDMYSTDELTSLLTPPEHVYDKKEISSMSMYGRLSGIYEILNVMFPLPHFYTVASTIDKILKISYMSRECRISKRGDPDSLNKGGLRSIKRTDAGRSQFFLIKGLTGVGKTVSVHQVLKLYPQAVRHVVKGHEYTQILYLYGTGHVGNLSSLIISYARKIDELLDMGEYHTAKVMNKSLAKQCEILADWVEIYHIGLLCIDEIQYLEFGNSPKSFEHLVTLSEQTGCAIGMIGNREIDKKLMEYSRIAGRSFPNVINVSISTSLDRKYFELATRKLWTYQYTDTETKMDDRILTQLLRDSMYNISLLKNLIVMVQTDAVQQEKKDKITPAFIHKTAQKYFSDLQVLLERDTPESELEVLNIFENGKQKIADELKKEEEKAKQEALKNRDDNILPENQQKFDVVILALSSLSDSAYSEDRVRHAIDLCMMHDHTLQFCDTNEILRVVKERLEGKVKPAKPKKAQVKNVSDEDEEAISKARKSA